MIPGLLGIIPGLLGIIPGLFGANILGLLLIQPRSLCGIIPGSLGFLDPRWLALAALAHTGSRWLALTRAGSRWLARAAFWLCKLALVIG